MSLVTWFQSWRLNSGIKKIDKLDEKLTEGLEKYNLDFDRMDEERRANRSDLLKTKNAILRVEENKSNFYRSELKKLVSLEGNELTAYQRDVQKQILDLHKILEGIDNVAKNEVNEILYDVRSPLLAYSKFVDSLRKVLADKHKVWAMSKEQKKEVLAVAEEIQSLYHSIVKDTLSLIQSHISKSYNDADANASEFTEILRQRAKAKSLLSRKRLSLLKSIDRIEKLLGKYAFNKDMVDAQNELLKIIVQFREQFKQLSELCEDRIKVADDMIIRIFKLEIKYVSELKKLKDEIDKLTKEIGVAPKTKEVLADAENQLILRFEKFDKLFGKEALETLSRFEREIVLKNTELKRLEEKIIQEEAKITKQANADLKIIEEELDRPKKGMLKKIIILGLAANLFVQTTMVAPEMGGGPLRESNKVRVIDNAQMETELENEMLTHQGTTVEAEEIISFETTLDPELDVPASFAPKFDPRESQIFQKDYSDALINFNEDLVAGKKQISDGVKESAKDSIRSIEKKYNVHIPAEVRNSFENMSPDSVLKDANLRVLEVQIIGLACIKGASQTKRSSGLTGFDSDTRLAEGRGAQWKDSVLQKVSQVFGGQGFNAEISDSVVKVAGIIARDTENAEKAVGVANDWLKTNPSNIKVLDSKGKEIKSIDFRRIKTDHADTYKKELDNFDRVMNKMKEVDVKTYESVVYDVLKNDRGVIVKMKVKVDKPIKVAVIHEKFKDPYLVSNYPADKIVPPPPIIPGGRRKDLWRNPMKVNTKSLKQKPKPNLPRYEASRRKLVRLANGSHVRQKTFGATKGGRA